MLVIRTEQMASLEDAGADHFERRLCEHVNKFFPKQTEFIGEEAVRTTVQRGVEAAEQHGFKTQREIAFYVSLMFLLGSGFDRDPQYPWVRKHLEGNGERIRQVYDEAMTYIDATAGRENQHLIRALLRLRKLDVSKLPEVLGDEPHKQIHLYLTELYPSKANAQGVAITLRLVNRAVKVARQYNLRSAQSVIVLTIHLFMFGMDVASDTQFPWVERILAGGSPSRTEELARASVEFLNHILARRANA